MSICAYCGDPVLWVTTAKGKKMPVNPGLIQYWARKEGKSKVVTTSGNVISADLTGDIPADGLGYTSHFATCPFAEQEKRRKQNARPGGL